MGASTKVNEDRAEILRERVEVALEQFRRATPQQLAGLLHYWFGVLFDEGVQMAAQADAPTLKMTTARLQEMNERLKRSLDEDK